MAVLPLAFELSLDNLRRKCRLVWRKGNFFGVAFESPNTSTDIETDSEADFGIPEPALLALDDPPQLAYFDTADGWSESTSKVIGRKSQRQANLRFTIGVAVALALPVVIGMSVHIATTAVSASELMAWRVRPCRDGLMIFDILAVHFLSSSQSQH